jgi:hypothetical protein
MNDGHMLQQICQMYVICFLFPSYHTFSTLVESLNEFILMYQLSNSINTFLDSLLCHADTMELHSIANASTLLSLWNHRNIEFNSSDIIVASLVEMIICQCAHISNAGDNMDSSNVTELR